MSPPGTIAREDASNFGCVARLAPHWEKGGVLFYRHQFEAARRVLDDMGGSAILADEVGLGKTFEAGLVLAEEMERGRASRALILVPASLLEQWREEMARFFDLRFVIEPEHPERYPLVLASLDWAKREGRRERYASVEWDAMIVDEAHKLKNPRTVNYRFVRSIRRKTVILLTATPIENDLNELYSLVSIVRPAAFGSYMAFYRQFVMGRHLPKNEEMLREILDALMIRRTRFQAGLELPPREVELVPLELTSPERELYEAVTGALRDAYAVRRREGGNLLPLILVQREVCSSSFALLGTLERLDPEWLGDRAHAIRDLARAIDDNVKAHVAIGLVRRLGEHAIIFTEYRDTQEFLVERLRSSGVPVHVFHGSLGAREKRSAQEAFRREGGVLVSTEAGGLGVNLQFCHIVVNYDLPWNPMRIEQRIGRVQRLGQTKNVVVVNLFARRTVEEHLLRLLHAKIDLFRRVIGDLDVILRSLERERPIEMQLFDAFLSAEDEVRLEAELDRLGAQFTTRSEMVANPRPSWIGDPQMVY